ncbi:MAG: hypothetical protein M3256_09600 [Actinomycetota bacterium]|nr:hypothetical protein [Actinomycetota bacterium]
MIWVTWAQHRREALASGLVFAAAATLLVVTGLLMLADWERSGAGHCVGAGVPCDTAAFPLRWHRLTVGAPLALMTLPALLGVFIAAPLLSREFEQGTYLFAWSQSITKLRWAVVKLGVISLAVIVAAAALGALVVWWHAPLDSASFDGPWGAFDVEGIAPVAYATFALTLGTLAGLLIRRMIPAMALTLFVFAGVRVLVAGLRPHFLPPVTASAQTLGQGSWVVTSNYYADAQGHLLSLDQVNSVMSGYNGPSASGLMDYMHLHGVNLVADYQPLERFWTFQLIEAAVFFGLAIALTAISLWWLQRRA